MPTKTLQSESQKVPKLRFSSFKGGWNDESFQDIFTFHKTNSLSRAELSPSGEVMNIHYGDIHKNYKSHFDFKVEKFSYINNSQTIGNLIQDGDLVIADASEDRFDIGKSVEVVNTNKKKSVAGLHTFLVRPKGIALGFPGFLMGTENVRRQLSRIATGASVLGISKTEVGKIRLNIPSLSEQQKIAEFLGGVDEWIENLREQKESLVSYKKGMMQKIFSQGIRFKDDKGKEFPMWVEKKLGEVGETYNGLIGKAGDDFGDGDSFITYKQIFDDSEINIGKFSLVSVDPQEKQNKAQFGDILFTMSSETPHEVGFSSVLLDKSVSPYLNSFSFGLRPNSLKKLDPYFAKLFFRSPLFRKDVVKLAQGSTRYNISKIGFMKIKIMLPTFPEQQKIAEFLGSIDKVLESKQQQITQAEQWKKGLMQGLFV